MSLKHFCRASAMTVCLILFVLCFAKNGDSQNQTFSSGSTGADGALNFTTAGTVLFDPTTIPNHVAGDTMFNFTTINIAQGVTVRLDSRNLPGPVYWLASGAVTIAGTLDLSGGKGHPYTGNRADRVFSTPGAGGFAGGAGGGAALAAEPGAGPGGGTAPAGPNPSPGNIGVFTGSQYLIPLIGGSGASGTLCNSGIPFSGGGGAGGGAVLIASSVSITVSSGGTITADGGSGPGDASCYASGAGGSGGAIRLMAPTITTGGTITAIGNTNETRPGGSGYIRFEGFQVSLGGTINGPRSVSTPNQIALPATPPALIKVASIAGISINSNPFTFPDTTINSTSPVPVIIQGQYVPPGAVPTLYILSESGPDQVIVAPAMQGTLQSTTSTVNIAYPPLGSRGLVRMSWTQ